MKLWLQLGLLTLAEAQLSDAITAFSKRDGDLAERVVAIDPRFVPLGAPIFMSTNLPNSNKPLNRLMMAQDTGGAIKGGVRADFFWGSGPDAGKMAGSMKQSGRIWVLLPKDFPLPK